MRTARPTVEMDLREVGREGLDQEGDNRTRNAKIIT
jgi:hypothetical protein